MATIAPLTVSVTDAARLMGIGRTTAYKLIGAGEIETVQIGARRLVVVESIDNYVHRLRAAS